MGLEAYSDDELFGMLAGDGPPIEDVSSYSDDDLMKMLAPEPPKEEPSFVSKRAKTLAEDFAPRGDEGILESVARSPLRMYNVAGEVAGGLGDIAGMGITAGAKALYGTLPEEAQKGFESTMKDVGEYVAPTIKTLSDAYGRGKKEYPDLFRFIESTANIAGAIPLGWVAARTAPIAKAAVGETGEMIARGAGAAKQALYPKPNPEEALGQILRSKGATPDIIERDLAKGMTALGEIDTKGVKTFAGLSEKLDEAASPIMSKVDDALLQDPKRYSLEELVTTKTTQGGAKVSSNYVDDALTHLEEYYTKVGEPVRAAEMVELRQKAISEGLLKKEVNDIARTYNAEFSEKMFNKGDVPLTSVNAEHARNVRSELKNVARSGMDDTAKELDETYGAIMNTKRLIEQSEAAIKKMQLEPRGLGTKAAAFAVDKLDMLTGNLTTRTLRWITQGKFADKPLGVLDLEKKIKRNLKIVEKEIARTKKAPTEGYSPKVGPFVKSSDVDGMITSDLRVRKDIEADALQGQYGEMNIPERPPTRSPLERSLNQADDYLATEGGAIDTAYRISPQELEAMRAADMMEGAGVSNLDLPPRPFTSEADRIARSQRSITGDEPIPFMKRGKIPEITGDQPPYFGKIPKSIITPGMTKAEMRERIRISIKSIIGDEPPADVVNKYLAEIVGDVIGNPPMTARQARKLFKNIR